MAVITVEARADDEYEVLVTDAGPATTHAVTLSPGAIDRLAPGVAAEALIEASFRFLLDREPKESILGRFDLEVIGRYFPDYAGRIGDYL
ncbi:MAG TPA: hypothetical protein VLD62_03420 [Acidimicrobiia bacterium]|nr:hypothetical protein [Acidimicrobiia bacterium]